MAYMIKVGLSDKLPDTSRQTYVNYLNQPK